MTDIGYDGIIKMITEMRVNDTPRNCGIVELYNWTQGYTAAICDITKMIEDLKEANAQRK